MHLLADAACHGIMTRPVGMLGGVTSHAFPVDDAGPLARLGIYGVLGVEIAGGAEIDAVAAGHERTGVFGKGRGGESGQRTNGQGGEDERLVHDITPCIFECNER